MTKAEKAAETAAADTTAAAAPDRITLRQPFVDNGNQERGINAVILLGHGPAEIDPDRAAYLVEEKIAVYGDDPVPASE